VCSFFHRPLAAHKFVQCCEALRYVTGKNANAMKRWNGWGEETITPHLSGASTHFLQQIIGMGTPTRDATFAEVASCVPASRLPSHPLILTDSGERLLHTRGQSIPDWIAVRGGCIDTFPDGVAFPESENEVCELIHYACEVGAHLIPYGGGTSVVGHINPLPGDRPVLTIDLKRMSSLQTIDERKQLATFGAGVAGLPLEAQLRAHGCTLSTILNRLNTQPLAAGLLRAPAASNP